MPLSTNDLPCVSPCSISHPPRYPLHPFPNIVASNAQAQTTPCDESDQACLEFFWHCVGIWASLSKPDGSIYGRSSFPKVLSDIGLRGTEAEPPPRSRIKAPIYMLKLKGAIAQNGAFHLGPPNLLALCNFLARTSTPSKFSGGGALTHPALPGR